ncbi:MAG: hypothetical protein ABH889_01025 [Candidatus Portnoybacteria bacterium]
MAENSFLAFLGFFLVIALIGTFVFYQYGYRVGHKEIDISEEVLRFNTDKYQEVLIEWQKRNQRFSEADLKQYQNPFGAPSLVQ